MIRPLTLVTMVAAMGAGMHVYQTKHEVALLDRELRAIARQIEEQGERTLALRAEWARLTEPERLRQAAQRLLQLEAMAPAQFLRLADAERRMAPPATYDGPAALFAPRDSAAGAVMLAASEAEAARPTRLVLLPRQPGPEEVRLAAGGPAATPRSIASGGHRTEAQTAASGTARGAAASSSAAASQPTSSAAGGQPPGAALPRTGPAAEPAPAGRSPAAVEPPPASVPASGGAGLPPALAPSLAAAAGGVVATAAAATLTSAAASASAAPAAAVPAPRPAPRPQTVTRVATAPRPALPPAGTGQTADLPPVAGPAAVRPALATRVAPPEPSAPALAAAGTGTSMLGANRPLLAPPVPFGSANAASLAGGPPGAR